MTDPKPEDAKFLESLNDLLKISKTVKPAAQESDSDDDVPTIPEANKLNAQVRMDPLKSNVPPEYVKKVLKDLDSMNVTALKQALALIKVSTTGTKKDLKRRVANHYRKENTLLLRKTDGGSDKTLRYFDYLIATDFECTCVEIIYNYPHEIIEIPAVLIDVKDMKIISTFRTYVRPKLNPILSDFCKKFTNINQETVDNAPYFLEALELLYSWMKKHGLSEKGTRFAFVTDGPHDMWKFMQYQCGLSRIKMPHMFRNFINVKKTFQEKFKNLPKGNGLSGIENMLAKFNMEFKGNKHSGLDDATNIAAICLELMKRRIELRINQRCVFKIDNELPAEKSESNEEVDISRKDFKLWMRKLPLKLSTVTRREFLSEEYLECESCDEAKDEEKTPEEFLGRLVDCEEVQKMFEKDYRREEEMEEKGQVVQPDDSFIHTDSSSSDHFSLSDGRDLDSPPNSECEVTLNSIWEMGTPDNMNFDFEPRSSTSNNHLTQQSSTSISSESSIGMIRPPKKIQPPSAPKNSLASSHKRTNSKRFN